MQVRPAAVAGFFYPDDPAVLRRTVEGLLARCDSSMGEPAASAGAGVPRAIVAPHAGFAYSGPIAASAFRSLRAVRASAAAGAPRRVVVIGPAHRVALRGLGLPLAERFATPLGEVAIDVEGCAAIAGLPQVSVRPDAHHEEHAIEVELPFLQVVLGDFQLVPLVVGRADAEAVAAVLERLWDDDTLVVVSSDLSHYLTAAAAERADRATSDQVLALAGPLGSHQACGAAPLNGLLAAARRRGLAPRLLDLRHSGDTAGDRSRVVGYGAWAFAAGDGNGAADDGLAARGPHG